MSPSGDEELLEAYLANLLSDDNRRRLEGRLKAEPALAEQLVRLAREESILTGWAQATAASPLEPVRIHPPGRGRRLAVVGVAAGLLLASTVAMHFALNQPDPEQIIGPAPEVVLDDVQGTVEIADARGNRSTATEGQGLTAGQTVRTLGEGSFAAVRFRDGTRLELSTDTALEVRLPQQGSRAHLAEGFVRADVANNPLILTTPHAVIKALATTFLSTSLGQTTRVDLERGSLEVVRAEGGEPLALKEGRSALVGPPEGPIVEKQLPPQVRESRLTLREEAGPPHGLAFAPDGKRLAVGGWKGGINLWDLRDGTLLQTLGGHARRARHLAWPRPDTLISGADDRLVKVWDLKTAQEQRTLPKANNEVSSLALAPSGTLLAYAPFRDKKVANQVCVKLMTLGGEQKEALWVKTRAIESLAFSPDGGLLAAGTQEGRVIVWDVAGKAEVASFTAHEGRIHGVAFNPEGKLLATGASDRLVKVWDVDGWKPRQTLYGHPREVMTVAFSPAGPYLASGGNGPTIALWDVRTGRQVRAYVGHKFTVTQLAFSPDGKLLATSGWSDRTVRVWEVPEPPAVPTRARLAG